MLSGRMSGSHLYEALGGRVTRKLLSTQAAMGQGTQLKVRNGAWAEATAEEEGPQIHRLSPHHRGPPGLSLSLMAATTVSRISSMIP